MPEMGSLRVAPMGDPDPMFVDAEHSDFRLKPESSALKQRFKPIPFDKFLDPPGHWAMFRPVLMNRWADQRLV